jgi:sucrose-6-phosphate hydrolase SacC (GH32 family)
MNDPNGLIWHDGVYHLFFQHNPHGERHENMSWGHATSTDLLTWTEHPVALLHDEAEDIFSGSIVWDQHNSSGLSSIGVGPLVAIYTAARRSGDHQAQALAFSVDGGSTWKKHGANPVLDLGTDDFRDPKIFRYRGSQGDWWVMVAVEATHRRVVLYRSDDLLHWSFLSSYGPAGSVEGLWECPDLFPLMVGGDPENIRWVLLVSVATGAIAGGSGTQYAIGSFDGTTFTPMDPAPPIHGPGEDLERLPWLDRGRDCYAGVTFSGLPDDERVLIGWMSNWDYAQDFPTSPWRGSMTIPRQLALHPTARGIVLTQRPVLPAGWDADVNTAFALTPGAIEVVDRLPLCGLVRVDIACAAEDVVHLTVEGADGTAVRVSYDAASARLEVDRTTAGDFHPLFPSRQSAPHLLEDGWLRLRILLDAASLEIFAGSGETVISDQVLMEHPWGLAAHVTGSPASAEITVKDLSLDVIGDR